MTRTTSRDRTRQRLLRVILAVGLLLLVSGLVTSASATPAPNVYTAGLVIKHGDGRVLYFYLHFDSPVVSATDLLHQAGVSIDLAQYAGLGQAVCRIDGEGCPSTNCFCKSYANPSIYWRYQRRSDAGTWVAFPYAASQKSVHDGDVIGFSWSSKDGDLPNVSLADIARLNGVVPLATSSSVPAVSSTPDAVETRGESSPSIASPSAIGVEVRPSGTKSVIETGAGGSNSSSSSYVWFGAGVVIIALTGVVVAVRRRRLDE